MQTKWDKKKEEKDIKNCQWILYACVWLWACYTIFKSIDFLLEAGGVRIPGGHGILVVGSGDASWFIIVSADSSCSRRKMPLSWKINENIQISI